MHLCFYENFDFLKISHTAFSNFELKVNLIWKALYFIFENYIKICSMQKNPKDFTNIFSYKTKNFQIFSHV